MVKTVFQASQDRKESQDGQVLMESREIVAWMDCLDNQAEMALMVEMVYRVMQEFQDLKVCHYLLNIFK